MSDKPKKPSNTTSDSSNTSEKNKTKSEEKNNKNKNNEKTEKYTITPVPEGATAAIDPSLNLPPQPFTMNITSQLGVAYYSMPTSQLELSTNSSKEMIDTPLTNRNEARTRPLAIVPGRTVTVSSIQDLKNLLANVANGGNSALGFAWLGDRDLGAWSWSLSAYAGPLDINPNNNSAIHTFDNNALTQFRRAAENSLNTLLSGVNGFLSRTRGTERLQGLHPQVEENNENNLAIVVSTTQQQVVFIVPLSEINLLLDNYSKGTQGHGRDGMHLLTKLPNHLFSSTQPSQSSQKMLTYPVIKKLTLFPGQENIPQTMLAGAFRLFNQNNLNANTTHSVSQSSPENKHYIIK